MAQGLIVCFDPHLVELFHHSGIMAFWLYIYGPMRGAYAKAFAFPAPRNNREAQRNIEQAPRNIIAPRNIHKAKRKIIAQMRIIRAHRFRYCANAGSDVRLLRNSRRDVTLLREGNFRPAGRHIIALAHFAAHVLKKKIWTPAAPENSASRPRNHTLICKMSAH
jgi:hypothetical protein